MMDTLDFSTPWEYTEPATPIVPGMWLPPCVVCGKQAGGMDRRDQWLCTPHLDDPMCLEDRHA